MHGSTRQTLPYLGVQSVLPRLQDSQPVLGKRAGKREYLAWRELSGSQATLTPQSLAHHLPGTASFHLFQKPPRTDGFKAPPAPPQSASLSTQTRVGSAQQVSPVAQPGPALRSGQHPADPAPLPSPRSNWAPHTPLHTMLLQVNRALPQHPDGHTRPLHSGILRPPRSGDLRARLWPGTCKAQSQPPTMLPKAAEATSIFCARARRSSSAQAIAAAASGRHFAQAQYPNTPFSRLRSSLSLRFSPCSVDRRP